PLEGQYISTDMREHVPLALAMFYVTKGNPRDAVLVAANFGRDSDSIGTSSASIAGAFRGISGFPERWLETVIMVNPDPNLEQMCTDIAEIAMDNITKMKRVIDYIEALA
ncbi:MAG: ADP-ribosylglycohydrolase family protein, partial [Candidatus Atribacteria bacterium]|nr:ADP-ribosylglycohydrolase family protein [Candidatus Atribacteria bacterium]